MALIERGVALVRRDDVPSMRTVLVDGVEHWLGHVKDFTKNPTLVDFLPKDNRVSMAWVRLEAGERLDEHIHPVDSMILLCEGSARTLGDVREVMKAGDVLLVRQRRPHGFIGMPPDGFWGLSIQFDSRGLYEDIEDPWATFLAGKQAGATFKGSLAEELFQRNEEYMERFDKHRLFALVRNGLLNDPQTRKRFLDCFQVWSNYFQKMVLTRVVTLRQPAFEKLAWLHLIEELGHNRNLAQSRADLQPVFDSVLEATSAWFSWKTGMISDVEKVNSCSFGGGSIGHLLLQAPQARHGGDRRESALRQPQDRGQVSRRDGLRVPEQTPTRRLGAAVPDPAPGMGHAHVGNGADRGSRCSQLGIGCGNE